MASSWHVLFNCVAWLVVVPRAWCLAPAPLRLPSLATCAADAGAGVFATREELALAGTAIGFGLLVLVEAGLAPVNCSTEPELANFQSNEAGLTALAFVLLRGYKRAISVNLPKNCRFIPTCSEYAALAIDEYGLLRGATLAAWRVARCNPLGKTGYDPPTWPPPSF